MSYHMRDMRRTMEERENRDDPVGIILLTCLYSAVIAWAWVILLTV